MGNLIICPSYNSCNVRKECPHAIGHEEMEDNRCNVYCQFHGDKISCIDVRKVKMEELELKLKLGPKKYEKFYGHWNR